MKKYVFSDQDRALAESLASDRNMAKEARRLPDRIPSTDEWRNDRHYFGILAEIAVTKIFHCPLDLKLYAVGDDGHDTILGNLKVEVKYTIHGMDSHLFISNDRPMTADLFIFVIGDDKQMWIIGYASKDDFANAETKDLGNYGKPVKVIHASKLNRIEDILPEMKDVNAMDRKLDLADFM